MKHEIERAMKEYNSLPDLMCNHCGVVFKGNHSCNYELIKSQNVRLRAALEFYAGKDNYSIWTDTSNNCPTNSVTLDGGYRARGALGLEEK